MRAEPRLEAQELKQRLRDPLQALADIAPAFQEAADRSPRHVPCPIHGGKDGFRIWINPRGDLRGICNTCHGGKSDGIYGLLQWACDMSFPQALDAVANYLGGGATESPTTAYRAKTAPEPDERKQRRIQKTWANSVKPCAAVTQYLYRRGLKGIGLIPEVIRGYYRFAYWSGDSEPTYHPAMVARIVDPYGRPVSNHLTYLSDDGHKADVENPKKIQSPALPGSLNGCAIRLYEPAQTLCLAEGVETALSVYAATGLPVWACMTANLLERVVVPSHAETIHVFADKDRSMTGEMAANRLAERLVRAGKTVKICLPPAPIPEGEKSIDWLDILNNEAVA